MHTWQRRYDFIDYTGGRGREHSRLLSEGKTRWILRLRLTPIPLVHSLRQNTRASNTPRGCERERDTMRSTTLSSFSSFLSSTPQFSPNQREFLFLFPFLCLTLLSSDDCYNFFAQDEIFVLLGLFPASTCCLNANTHPYASFRQ